MACLDSISVHVDSKYDDLIVSCARYIDFIAKYDCVAHDATARRVIRIVQTMFSTVTVKNPTARGAPSCRPVGGYG